MHLKYRIRLFVLAFASLTFVNPVSANLTNVNGVEIEVLSNSQASEEDQESHAVPSGFDSELTYNNMPSVVPTTEDSENKMAEPDEIEKLIDQQETSETVINPVVIESSTQDIEASNTPDLWARVRGGFAMPERHYAHTQKHEQWYSSRPQYMERIVQRSQRYLYHVVQELEKRNMPFELALLPVIESAYNPNAYSSAQAAGMWQFIPSTGKKYGLKQTYWADNRRNIVAATDAALTYLQELHGMFGKWDLALAAYNAGEGRVSREIAKNRAKGLSTDYASLALPKETRNYVPKLMAVKHIIAEPYRYGIHLAKIPNKPYFASVLAPKQIDKKVAIQLAGITAEEFKALNPSHKRPVIVSQVNDTHHVLLPIHAIDTFNYNLQNHDKRLTSWQPYHAKRGERISAIAKKFNISTSQLKKANSLAKQSKIRVARAILVPNHTANEPNLLRTHFKTVTPAKTFKRKKRSIRYRVKKGDTLSRIAKLYGVTSKQIKRGNGLRSSRIKVGQRLVIAANRKPSTNKTIRYKVRRGDTVSTIAKRFGISTKSLKRSNKLRTNKIKVGQRLIIKLKKKRSRSRLKVASTR